MTRVIPLLIDPNAARDDFPELLADKRYVQYPDPVGWIELVTRLREDVGSGT